MRNFMWIGGGLVLLSLVAFPQLGLVLFALLLTVSLWFFTLRGGWRFIAPERAKLWRGIALSVERGPVASGLVPFLAFCVLCLLVLAAALGVRL